MPSETNSGNYPNRHSDKQISLSGVIQDLAATQTDGEYKRLAQAIAGPLFALLRVARAGIPRDAGEMFERDIDELLAELDPRHAAA